MNTNAFKIDDENLDYSLDSVIQAAYENFGIKYLYPWQRMVISNILEAYEFQKSLENLSEEEKKKLDEENKDSFCKGRQIVLLPTGAGKSLCFQIPALIFDAPTLVIYPLLALMTDQQRRMEDGALGCVLFRGGQTQEIWEDNFKKLDQGAKIIIANPEILQNDRLLLRLKKYKIRHIAIDEVHCVEAWGDTFRPAYLELPKAINTLRPPVITAFTATASPQVLNRIAEVLFNGEAHIVRSESDRQNIHYFVHKAAAKKKEAIKLALTEEHPMIIFCGTRNKAEDMSRELNLLYNRKISQFYHAGLEREEKDEVEKWFFESKEGILCATCAYGMGVDKKDIKTVVHLEASETAEAYTQEAGRGGRDGSVAKAILIWSLEDSIKYSSFPKDSRQASMKKFAETSECRRQVLLDALGAEQAVCSGCDNCNNEKYDSDIEEGFKLIKKNRHFYDMETGSTKLFEKMNRMFLDKFGLKFWNNRDSKEVFLQLKKAGWIKESGPLWKNKFKVCRTNP